MNLESHLVNGPLLPLWICEQTAAWEEALARDGAAARSGACASFQGIIRADAVGEDTVEAIEYSAYAPLAERLFNEMERSVANRHNLHAVRIWHSVGLVRAGQCSMLVVVRAGHRAEAFDGLRAAVEAVKAGAPVWKRELLSGGGTRWVEGTFAQQIF